MLVIIRKLHPEQFEWREPPYEYELDRLPIEILCGSRGIVDLIEGGASPEQIRESWRSDVANFMKQREPYLLYE